MCTVIFIPDGNRSYFASLRDENPLRARAMLPKIIQHDSGKVLAPVDPEGGGTWLGVTATGVVIILLNGGFEKHVRKEHYSKSRGLVVAELLQSEDPMSCWQKMVLDGIEPFTLLMYSEETLQQLVWDGSDKHSILLDDSHPHIFSSSTLYHETARIERKELFTNWINTNPAITSENLFSFFDANPDHENGFLINRKERVKTLSYSFLTIEKNGVAKIVYHDLVENTTHQCKIEFKYLLNHSLLK